ncbi:MAG: hypothetical protein VKL41_20095 [Snowella sp.]|jgi:hypothetical protein|nr:hypothetical protein [Snowella sp.]PZV22938.1 MAG: hypothetical protein DCF12_19890 [Snowella sp.]
MSTAEMREQVKDYVDLLSAEKLLVAADFLAYLADKEEIDATEELLNTEGFREAFRKGQKSIEQGKVTPVEQLKRKY